MEEINMREIEVFLAVAKNQNISRTAEELYIAQSAVSSWIARMEEYCGVKLFRRTNRGVVLTPEGEMLYAELDIAYKRFSVSVNEICGTYTGRSAGTLKIGCLNRLSVWNTAKDNIRLFQERDPELQIQTERFNFHELRDKLLCEQLDLIFTISSDIVPYSEFDMLPLGLFPAFFLVQEGRKSVSELNGRTLIVETPTNRGWAEQVCRNHNIIPGNVKYVNSYILMAALVSAGEGFAVDGSFVTDNIHTPAVDLFPAETPDDVQIVLAWKKERFPIIAGEFIELLTRREQEEKA